MRTTEQTDERTDIAECRVAFATENLIFNVELFAICFFVKTKTITLNDLLLVSSKEWNYLVKKYLVGPFEPLMQ